MTTFLPPLLGVLAIVMPLLLGHGPDMLGASTVLGGAAVLATRTWLGIVAGVLAVLVAVTLPAGSPATLGVVVSVAGAGLALGILWRLLDDARPYLLGSGAGFAVFWLLALGALAIALPDGWVRVYASDGGPIGFEAIAKDAATGLRTPFTFPGYLPHASPAAGLTTVFPYAAALVAFGVLVPLKEPRLRQFAWWASLALGAVLMYVGLAGLLELLLAEPVAIGSTEQLASALNRAGGGSVAVELVGVPSEAFLQLDSRPAVDALRLVPGLMLAAIATLRLRPPSGLATASTPRLASQPLVLLAALAAGAAAFMVPPGQQLVLSGVVIVLLGAMVAAQFGHVSRRAPFGAAIVALAMTVYAWAGPVAGWLPR